VGLGRRECEEAECCPQARQNYEVRASEEHVVLYSTLLISVSISVSVIYSTNFVMVSMYLCSICFYELCLYFFTI
jgi:hypothetical protein